MEQCFRIALWMFCLLGYLQANPIPSESAAQGNTQGTSCSYIMSDLNFASVKKEVSCVQNVNFTSPTNVQKRCYTTALKCFMDGLEHAATICEDKHRRIEGMLETFETKPECYKHTNSSECKWENEGSRKKFTDFVKDIETFVQQLNSSGN